MPHLTAHAPLVFGPFEVNPHTGELRKRGARVRLSGQPFQILLLLLARPGDLVTRDELREQLWSDGTFVDFEHGLNAAINKLRRALGDSADHPRYIETAPGRGYRFIGTLEREPDVVPSLSPPLIPEQRREGRRVWARWPLAAAAAVCLAVGLVVAARLDNSSARQSPWKLTRLTADQGISDDPALSPDGTLLAYSSDPSPLIDRSLSTGGLDLYVKHVAGGSPIRLTFDGAGNKMPSFSADSSRIVFRSNRDGGGIYEIPALGGDPRLVSRDGFNPRFSPDGSQIAYWVGPSSVAASVPGSGSVWVVPVGGGQPLRVGPNFTTARFPIWHKDGKRLLVLGYTSTKAFDRSSIDWWVIAIDGSHAVRTGAYEALAQAELQPGVNLRTQVPAVPEPRCWSSPGDRVTFSVPGGDSWNLWDIELSPRTGKVIGNPQRLTTSAGSDLRASCASNGALAFAKVETRRDIWLLPFDLDRGASTGTPERMTHGPRSHDNPSLARNGNFVAFASDRSGLGNIWLRVLATGKELSVSPSPFVQRFPVSNPSGAHIAFSVYEKGNRVVYVSAPGGAPEKICDGCLQATDWSRDEKTLLVVGGDPYQINILDIASRRQTPLVTHPDYSVLYGRFSPDNRWVSFTSRVRPDRGRIAVAPVGESGPISESAWLTIAEAEPDDYANWSPDGKTLYFTSGKDGYSCLWAQRIDVSSRRLVGEAFAVQHFHGRLFFDHGGWSAAGGRIAIPLVEMTGNLWMMSRAGDGERANH
jgi:eukaryotic-like serine/threonine-protein kinase